MATYQLLQQTPFRRLVGIERRDLGQMTFDAGVVRGVCGEEYAERRMKFLKVGLILSSRTVVSRPNTYCSNKTVRDNLKLLTGN